MALPKIILASSSAYRKTLLEKLMIPFETINPDIDETPLRGESPYDMVERLSIEKAKTAASVYKKALVIGSDQVAVHGDKIVGKPTSHEHAVEQLTEASGKSIKLYSGLALINTKTKAIQSDVVTYTAHFRELTPSQIENYLEKEKPYNCAGSLRSEGLGVALLEKFEGDDPNALIGLPLIRLVSMLQHESYPIV